MKDRITLGHEADVAETAALTLADENAERRMFDELDRETDRKVESDRIAAALRRIERNLGPEMRSFARKVLSGKRWREIGMSKSTFHDTLKKVENFLRP
jgi:hypothetical protein